MPRKKRTSSPIQERRRGCAGRPTPLPVLDEGGQRSASRRIEARVSASSSIRPRRKCSRSGSASPRARPNAPSPSPASRAASRGRNATPCSRSRPSARVPGSGSKRNDPAARADRVELELGRGADQDQHEPGGGSSSVFRKALAASSFQVIGVRRRSPPCAIPVPASCPGRCRGRGSP